MLRLFPSRQCFFENIVCGTVGSWPKSIKRSCMILTYELDRESTMLGLHISVNIVANRINKQVNLSSFSFSIFHNGGPGGIRTRDLPVPRAKPCEPDVLRPHPRAYQAELPAQRIVRSEVTCSLIAISRSLLDQCQTGNLSR